MLVDIPQKIAFVAMPFGKRKVNSTSADVPVAVDFDAVWNRILAPSLEELGYIAVRADEQGGSVIVKDMLEQLLYADLVIADISIDNANVYYEAGIRHAAAAKGCILIGADWAEPVFDLEQIRQVRYPYDKGGLTDEGVAAAIVKLKSGIEAMSESISPVYELTPFPAPLEQARQNAFSKKNKQIAKFQKAARIANLKSGEAAVEAVQKLQAAFNDSDRKSSMAAQQVYTLIRDKIGWEASIEFIESLDEGLDEGIDESLSDTPFFKEQYALVMGKRGEAEDAIDTLQSLIEEQGKTAERLGLLGGRHKALFYKEQDQAKKKVHLHKAIEAYDTGMRLDLNEYYCACNLPRLLKSRNEEGDLQQAKFVAQLVLQVCDYRISHGTGDGWEHPTLLGAAFDTEDITTAQGISETINGENFAQWYLETTLIDLQHSVSLVTDLDIKQKLEEIAADLKLLDSSLSA